MASTNIDIKLAQLDTLDIKELTTKQLNGTGVFDVLMSATSLHVNGEFAKGNIRGTEYAQVYLGGLQAVLATSVEYINRSKLLGIEISNQEKQGLLTEAQIKLIEAQANQITLETQLKLPAEVANLGKQGSLVDAQVVQLTSETTSKLPAEIANIQASTALSNANKDRVVEELALVPLQGNLLTAQSGQVGAETILTNKRVDQITQELAKIPVEIQLLENQVINTQTQNELLTAQKEGIDLQNSKVPKEIVILEKQALQADAATALSTAQKDQMIAETNTKLPVEVQNLARQGENISKQVLLTDAQTNQTIEQTKRLPYDIEEIQARITNMSKQSLSMEKDIELKVGQLALQEKQLLISAAELAVKQQEIQVQLAAIDSQKAQADLYAQKVVTEKAQTFGNIAQEGSVLGANIKVLIAQADGYKRDAEQKSARILVDTWNVRRNSDEGTEANVTNQLHDANIGIVIQGLIRGTGLVPNTGP